MANKHKLQKGAFTIECNSCKSIWTEMTIYGGAPGALTITCLECENTWITNWENNFVL